LEIWGFGDFPFTKAKKKLKGGKKGEKKKKKKKVLGGVFLKFPRGGKSGKKMGNGKQSRMQNWVFLCLDSVIEDLKFLGEQLNLHLNSNQITDLVLSPNNQNNVSKKSLRLYFFVQFFYPSGNIQTTIIMEPANYPPPLKFGYKTFI